MTPGVRSKPALKLANDALSMERIYQTPGALVEVTVVVVP
jgi:hypothetical protein